jgi:hypothetical protein
LSLTTKLNVQLVGSTVFGVAQGTFDGQNVAIKVPDAGTPEEANNVSMMRREADVLSKCQHRQVS